MLTTFRLNITHLNHRGIDPPATKIRKAPNHWFQGHMGILPKPVP